MLQHNGRSNVLADAILGQQSGGGIDHVIQEIVVQEGDLLLQDVKVY